VRGFSILTTQKKLMLNLDTLKAFFDKFSKEPSFVMFVGLSAAIIFLHQDNRSKAEQLATKDKDCQELIKKCQMDATEQIKQSRENYEKELNNFVLSSNMERDSIYRFFYKKIRAIDSRVSSNINKINELKDEISN
jgi:hypothetical protein